MINMYILYISIFKLSIIATGIICIILGARLFKQLSSSSGSDTSIDADITKGQIKLTNAAPGTLFALFGAVLIGFMLAKAPAELKADDLQISDTGLSAENIVLRSNETSEINIIFNDYYTDNLSTAEETVDKLWEIFSKNYQ